MSEEILTTREILINAIMEYAGDEFETIQSVLYIAKESEGELKERLEGIKLYYQDEIDNTDNKNEVEDEIRYVNEINKIQQDLLVRPLV